MGKHKLLYLPTGVFVSFNDSTGNVFGNNKTEIIEEAYFYTCHQYPQFENATYEQFLTYLTSRIKQHKIFNSSEYEFLDPRNEIRITFFEIVEINN